MASELTGWLLASDEPWTRYRVLTDLLDRSQEDADVRAAREEMLVHPLVRTLISEAAAWESRPIKRHSDAGHPLFALSTLADFGLASDCPGISRVIESIRAHQAPEGAFQSLINVPRAFGGTGEDLWAWVLCDAPVLLYALLAMGQGADPHVQRAVAHLAGLVQENGWRCVAAPSLGKFRGPGPRRTRAVGLPYCGRIRCQRVGVSVGYRTFASSSMICPFWIASTCSVISWNSSAKSCCSAMRSTFGSL